MAAISTFGPILTFDRSGTTWQSTGLVSFLDGRTGLELINVHYSGGAYTTVANVLAPIDALEDSLLPQLTLPIPGGKWMYEFQAAQLSNGNFILASHGDGWGEAYLQVLNPDGSAKGKLFLVHSEQQATITEFNLHGLADGFVTSWTQRPDTGDGTTDVAFQFFDDALKSLGSVVVVGGTGNETSAALDVLADGNVALSWMVDQFDFANQKLVVQVLGTDGTAVSKEIKVEAAGLRMIDNHVTALSNGNFVVSWREVATAGSGRDNWIYDRLYDATGHALTHSRLVATAYSADQSREEDIRPAITALTDGRYVMGWTETRYESGVGLHSHAYLQLFDASGNRIGPVLHLGEDDGQVGEVTLDTLADGRFVASWQHGSAHVVETQILDARDHGIHLTGNDLADQYVGTGFADRIFGMEGADTLAGGARRDLLNGGGGDDVLLGEEGNDSLYGADGNDTIDGASGDDRIGGGKGDDLLTGGGGHDVFVFGPGGGSDTVTDFAHGRDRADLSAFGLADMADALSHASAAAGGVLLTFGADGLLLQGIALDEVSAGDLIL